jgi:endonuclease/exonuclease/phosphatase family metal-dependent hydrolase
MTLVACPLPTVPQEVGVDTQAETRVAPVSTIRIVTWNLHNFSAWGPTDYRVETVAKAMMEMGPDILAVQELKVEQDSEGEPPQAWHRLLGLLPHHHGVHAPWSTYDTTVGLIYRKDRVTVLHHEVLFQDDDYAFPRPPLRVWVSALTDAGEVQFDLIVLHLKAFGDSADRRRAALEKLDAYLDAEDAPQTIILGDFNDTPYDPEQENVYWDTFLNVEPEYYFVTMGLPLGTVSSTGWFHMEDGVEKPGEFLDHIILTGGVYDRMESLVPWVEHVPEAEYEAYEQVLSDHFPVGVDLTLVPTERRTH